MSIISSLAPLHETNDAFVGWMGQDLGGFSLFAVMRSSFWIKHSTNIKNLVNQPCVSYFQGVGWQKKAFSHRKFRGGRSSKKTDARRRDPGIRTITPYRICRITGLNPVRPLHPSMFASLPGTIATYKRQHFSRQNVKNKHGTWTASKSTTRSPSLTTENRWVRAVWATRRDVCFLPPLLGPFGRDFESVFGKNIAAYGYCNPTANNTAVTGLSW